MPNRVITSQDILRYIHRSTDDEQFVPQLAPLAGDYVDLYKGEIAVNYSRDNPGLFIRVGQGAEESSITDRLVRIGNIFVGDTEPFAQDTVVDKTGLAWYNTNRKHFFLYVDDGFIQITNEPATEVIAGIVRQATFAETILGFEDTGYVTPNKLKRWSDYYEFVPRRRGTAEVYINRLDGDDSLENDGSDPRYPFLSIERAVLESLKRDVRVIRVAAGDYLVDNHPGSNDIDSILAPAYYKEGQPVGPVNSIVLSGSVLEVEVEATEGTLVLDEGVVERLYRDQQLFFEKDGELIGNALIDSNTVEITSNPVAFRNLRGTVESGCQVRVAKLRSLNPLTGGLLLPSPYTITCDSQTIMRPLFISRFNALQDNNRTYLFKVTPGCKLENLTFADRNPVNHFMYSVIGNATEEDLQAPDTNYFSKAYKALGLANVGPNTSYEDKPGDFLRLSGCNLESSFGASLMTLSSFYEERTAEVIVNDLVMVSHQNALDAYDEGVLIGELEHWVVNVTNGTYRIMFNGGYTKYDYQFSVVADGNPTIVNVGNHLLLEDVPPNPSPVEN